MGSRATRAVQEVATRPEVGGGPQGDMIQEVEKQKMRLACKMEIVDFGIMRLL